MIRTMMGCPSHFETFVLPEVIVCEEMMVERKREGLWGSRVRELPFIDVSGDAPGLGAHQNRQISDEIKLSFLYAQATSTPHPQQYSSEDL